jgi:hypothetical protein
MNAIETYILNLFSTLPKTDEIEKLKKELLADMEEKYEELKEHGKSEHEAISTVISEFGNIHELLEEFNINVENTEPEIEKQSVINYFNESKKSFRKISYGVGMTLVGIGTAYLVYELLKINLIFTSTNNKPSLIPFIPLLIFAIPSLYLFISEGINVDKASKIKAINHKLSSDAQRYLNSEFELFKPKFTQGIVIGIILVLISPVGFFLLKPNNDIRIALGILILLLLIAVAVMIFINLGTYYADLQFFMVTKDYITKNAEVEKVLGAVAAFIFPIAFVGCVFVSLYYKKWILAIGIFFAVSIIYGAFAGAYSTMKNK